MRFRLLSSLIAAALVGAPALARAQVAADRILNAASAASPCPAESCLEVPGVANGVAVEITDTASGTWTAQFEISLGGESWTALGLSTADASPATVSSATAAGKWRGAAGFRFRVRLSAYTNGQPRVKIAPLSTPPTSGGGGSSSSGVVAQASTTSGQSGMLSQGAVTTVAPTYTTGQTNPLSLDVNGALRVAITSGAGSGGTALADRSGTFTPNATSFTPIGGFMDEVASDACTEGAPCAFRMTANRSLYVTGANGTFPATQSGTWTVQPGNTANTTAWLMTGTGGTFPVTDSGGSLTVDAPVGTPAFVRLSDGTNPITTLAVSLASVPSHAVTNAGTFVTQENGAALTSLQLIDDSSGSKAGGTAGAASFLVGGVFNTALPTLTNGQQASFQFDSSGRAIVSCGVGCSGSTFADNAAFTFGTTVVQPIAGVFDDTSSNSATENSAAVVRITASKALHVNLRDASGNALTPSTDQTIDAALTTTGPLMIGRGSTATPTAMSADNDATALWLDLNGRVHTAIEGIEDAAETAAAPLAMAGSVRRDTAASSAGTTGDNATINTDALGKLWITGSYAEDIAHTGADTLVAVAARRIDTPASSAGTSGDYVTIDSSPEGAIYTTPIATAGISAGALTHALQSAATTNATSVKGSAGNVYGIHAINTTATLYYLRLYNLAAAPTCSSATGFVESIPIPASASGAGIVIPFPVGKAFATGIAYCLTLNAASTDNNAAATGVLVGMEYK